MGLPLVGGGSPCFGCYTPCCFSYQVPVTAYDVWRLCRAIGAPWQQLVEAHPGSVDYWDSFRLDEGARRYSLQLRRKPGSLACQLLMQLPDGTQRCGVHPGRPLACRAYPLKLTPEPAQPTRHEPPAATTREVIGFVTHALCPPPQRRQFERAMPSQGAAVLGEMADLALHTRALERWDRMALRVPRGQSLSVGDYIEWMSRLHDHLEPLRQGERASWEESVARHIDEFPLPEVFAAGC